MISIEPSGFVFSKDQIYQQLQTIFADPTFAVSDILKRFLSFITEETLEGRSNQIKEYTIAVKVLHKPFGFNPKEDAIVRIHAGRLRRALRQYYKGNGATDQMYVSMPTGGYVPVFADKANPSSELFASNNNHIGQIQTDGMANDYSITGEMQYVDGRLQINVQMINKETHEQLWSQLIEYKLGRAAGFDVQDDVAKRLISAIDEYCRFIRLQIPPESKMVVA